MPNLPVLFWLQNRIKLTKKQMKMNDTCAKFPYLYDLHFNNYWQLHQSENRTIHLYSAFLDVREQNPLGPTVRILAMADHSSPETNEAYCQLWFNDSTEPVFAKVESYMKITHHNSFPVPYLLSCPIPANHSLRIPETVSLVSQPCDAATNSLKVVFDKPEPQEKKKFAVCVKFHYGPDDDISVRLAEWIELLHALGADKIFLYDLGVHPNVKKITDYYTEKGVVDTTRFSLPGFQPNLPLLNSMFLDNRKTLKRENELIPINDCFYRNMYRYEYISLQDSDEVIIPTKHDNWADMMEEALNESMKVMDGKRSSWHFRHVYFLDKMFDMQRKQGYFPDIPSNMHMMQHVYRSNKYNPELFFTKAFHNPERGLAMYNHLPTSCLPDGACVNYEVNVNLAQMHHYRKTCKPALWDVCHKYTNTTVEDTVIWKWKDRVVSGTQGALRQLGFFDKN